MRLLSIVKSLYFLFVMSFNSVADICSLFDQLIGISGHWEFKSRLEGDSYE